MHFLKLCVVVGYGLQTSGFLQLNCRQEEYNIVFLSTSYLGKHPGFERKPLWGS
jgi:hypothetical protein